MGEATPVSGTVPGNRSDPRPPPRRYYRRPIRYGGSWRTTSGGRVCSRTVTIQPYRLLAVSKTAGFRRGAAH
jgi:hypothetical protein